MKSVLTLFLIINIFITKASSQECGTPVECYVKAINLIKECKEDSRQQSDMFQEKFRLLEDKFNGLQKENNELKKLTSNQQGLINALQNKNSEQDSKISQSQSSITQLNQNVNNHQNVLNNYEARGVGQMRFYAAPNESVIKFDGFNHYAFWRSDNHFGICINNGACNVK